MASHEARRGRPKGSGLDDRSQLRLITELLARDPNLKPTTAIKAIGVTDPSAIRRLREKLKTEPVPRRPSQPPAVSPAPVSSAPTSRTPVLSALASPAPVPPVPISPVPVAAEAPPVAAVLAAPASPVRARAPDPAAIAADASPREPIPDSPASEPAPAVSSETPDVFTQWCALGLSAASSTLEAQMALFNDFLEIPQVQCALRHQILWNEVAKALCPKRSDIRTFH